MGEVIQFPKRDVAFKIVRKSGIDLCRECGLSQEKTEAVIAQYTKHHEKLFREHSVRFETKGATFSAQQAEAIRRANNDMFEEVLNFHLCQMTEAAMIIIGLLAREQLLSD